MSESERKWDPGTKRIVVLVIFILLALIVYRFRGVVPPLILALLLAFILDPVVDFLEDRTPLSRTLATALVFVALLLLLAAAPVIAVPTLVREIRSLNLDFAQIVADVERLIAQPVTLLGRELDLREVYQQLRGTLESYISTVAAGTFDIVFGFASTLFWLVFILLSAFYLVRDGRRITAWLDSLPPSTFRRDFVRLRQRITDVWHAFLRGQLLMGVLMILITTVAAAIVGLPNALALGILAGVTEFIPNIGPVIAAVPAVAVAFFEGSTWLPLDGFWFAVLVLGMYVLIQQVEGNILLPRVMGRSLNLHPLIVLVAIIAGGSLAGILGMLLAAPTVATLRVLAEYIYRRLTDQDPFPSEEEPVGEPQGGIARWLWSRARKRALADQWVVRPARPEDRADMEAICAQVWEGDDYVPEVWDEWLADPDGELTVVELKGRVVALSKLTRLADDEWWLEGLRVDPSYRRLGLAWLIQNHQVAQAERMGRGVLRFGTASYNAAVHKNAARGDFHRVARFVSYQADTVAGPYPMYELTPDDLASAWQLIEDSPVFQVAGQLYEVQWHWMTLTRERLAAELEAGKVWGVDVDGGLVAVAIVEKDTDRGRLAVEYIDGAPEGVTFLLWGLRVLANESGLDQLRLRLPDHRPLIEAAEAAGASRVRDHAVWIFERSLEGTASP
jgi:predicted PurR-regulated permease PerM